MLTGLERCCLTRKCSCRGLGASAAAGYLWLGWTAAAYAGPAADLQGVRPNDTVRTAHHRSSLYLVASPMATQPKRMTCSARHHLRWAALLLLLAACSEPSDCTLIAVPPVVVYVVDSLSGTPAAAGARGAVERGNFRDSLRPYQFRGLPPNDTLINLQAGAGPAGEYRITVVKTGFQPWEEVGVRIVPNACRYTRATLTARLRPAS